MKSQYLLPMLRYHSGQSHSAALRSSRNLSVCLQGHQPHRICYVQCYLNTIAGFSLHPIHSIKYNTSASPTIDPQASVQTSLTAYSKLTYDGVIMYLLSQMHISYSNKIYVHPSGSPFFSNLPIPSIINYYYDHHRPL